MGTSMKNFCFQINLGKCLDIRAHNETAQLKDFEIELTKNYVSTLSQMANFITQDDFHSMTQCQKLIGSNDEFFRGVKKL